MLVKAYCLDGQKIVVKEKEIKDLVGDNEVRIDTKIVGVCGSDTGAFLGVEEYLGDEMWGHEGIGVVEQVGKNVTSLKVGDCVSSYFHPAFWEKFDVPEEKAAKIPEINSKYILQPISCPLNALYDLFDFIPKEELANKKLLLIGGGFMGYIFSRYMKHFGINFDMVTNHNKEYFEGFNIVDKDSINENTYDAIIYASTNDYYDFIQKVLKVDGLLVHYATPRFNLSTNFFFWNWKSFKVIFPSPRGKNYIKAFQECVNYVDILEYDKLLKEYDISELEQVLYNEAHKVGIVKNSVIMKK